MKSVAEGEKQSPSHDRPKAKAVGPRPLVPLATEDESVDATRRTDTARSKRAELCAEAAKPECTLAITTIERSGRDIPAANAGGSERLRERIVRDEPGVAGLSINTGSSAFVSERVSEAGSGLVKSVADSRETGPACDMPGMNAILSMQARPWNNIGGSVCAKFRTGGATPTYETDLRGSRKPGCKESDAETARPSQAQDWIDDKTPKFRKSTTDRTKINPVRLTPNTRAKSPDCEKDCGEGGEPEWPSWKAGVDMPTRASERISSKESVGVKRGVSTANPSRARLLRDELRSM